MWLFIILLSVLVLSIVFFNVFDDYNLVMGISIVTSIVSGVWLFFFILLTSMSSYEYERFMVRRSAFEQTLNECRLNGNQYETAAIVKEVSEWNESLAENKLDNSKFLMETYVDDRFESLKPIK